MKKERTPLNLKIDSELHRQTKIRAAELRKTMTELVEAALRAYLGGETKRAGVERLQNKES